MKYFLISFILPIATLIVGYLSGLYFPIKWRREDAKPKISIGPFQEGRNCFDITNHGGNILEMSVNLIWLQSGKQLEKTADEFFNYYEDLQAHPHKCNTIKNNETKKVSGCPAYSDNGKVQIVIEGKDVNGIVYLKSYTLTNNVKNSF